MTDRLFPTSSSLDERVARLAALVDPTRRRLFRLVASSPEPVGRDEAASRLGITRGLAAFHLEHLARAGLLSTEYRRLSGRTGPGAGRPAKLYRAATPVEVSVPPRRYDVAAEVFAAALERIASADGTMPGGGVIPAVDEAAIRQGEALGLLARGESGDSPDRAAILMAVVEALDRAGFDPGPEGLTIRLRSCPFQSLTPDHEELTCRMNGRLLDGFVQGLGLAGVHTVPEPPGSPCCVALSFEMSPTS